MNYKEVLKCLKMPNYVSNDFYSMLFARSIGGAAGYDELTGTPPLTFTANGRNLINYRIYGANDGVGEQTENLFDIQKVFKQNTAYYIEDTIYITTGSLWYDILCFTSGASATPVVAKMIHVNAGTYTIKIGKVEKTSGSSVPVGFVLFTQDGSSITNVTNSYVLNESSKTFTLENDGYISLRVSEGRPTIQGLMIVEGSTAPAQYIPFGYQINAVVRSENLFDKDAKDTSNGYAVNSYIDSNGDIQFANLYCVSEYMTVEPNQIYYLKDLVTTGTSCNAAFYDTNKSLISTTSVFNVASLTTPPNAIYMRISFYSTLAYKTMVSTTEITTYQPYSRTDIPIYIGDTPLAQGEYVDYGEQKVYKYVGGELTPTDPPVELPALPTIDGTTVADFDNEPKPSEMYIKYPK